MTPKVKVGVSLDRETRREIDAIVESSKHLNIRRSQVIEATLTAFFKSPFDHAEKARDLVVRLRTEPL